MESRSLVVLSGAFRMQESITAGDKASCMGLDTLSKSNDIFKKSFCLPTLALALGGNPRTKASYPDEFNLTIFMLTKFILQ